MNNSAEHIDNRESINILLLFVYLLLINFSAFSQSVYDDSIAVINPNNVKNSVEKENSRMSSNMELIIWFMGSKQDPNSTISKEGRNAKKEIISSGLAPNRLLIKAFLRKAASYECLLS